ncbi:cation-transporting P-type ATPase [Patescibacteria group bacterium]|nr:MAG: cation-transporting P-type ATPase [Patescibacteria group bacterium]
MERPWHAQSAAAVLKALGSPPGGLAGSEAARRLRLHGPNALPTVRHDGWAGVLARQVSAPLMLLLLAAAVVSLALGDKAEAAVIACAFALNAALGFFQEYRAARTLEAIRSLVVPMSMVRRDGREREIRASELVLGDRLVLRAGDRVAADARLIEAVACETNEAPLTGESMPVAKGPEALRIGTILAERVNMAFAGTIVVAGRAEAVVVATGSLTELGKIASLVVGTEEPETSLQAQLRQLSARIGLFAVATVLALFVLGIASGRGTVEMLKTGIALAVSAVPEGLMVSVTMVLAVGMRRILKRGSLVRRLVAAETLGSVSVICTDKTGTLTEGEMRVAEVVPAEGAPSAADVSHLSVSRGIVALLEAGMLVNDAVVERVKGIEQATNGSPTERALMGAGLSAGIDAAALRLRHPRLAEIPFDSRRKDMATLHRWAGKEARILYKGAPEFVLARCASYLGEDGDVHPFTDGERRRVSRVLARLLKGGVRVIGCATREAGARAKTLEADDLRGMAFLGFLGLRDPLRPQAQEQVARARAAGVRTVLVTGDHPDTARLVALEAGLDRTHRVVTGEELDRWDDRELARRVTGIDVYARVEPRHKIRLVEAWRARGASVAMVGDGVNDAPALKAADVGVALGSGTEVAKEAADIILLDNDLGTVTAAVEQGRVLFENIRRVSVYLLSSCFTEILLIGGSIIAGLPLPLTALQILWINLVADGLPSAALTMEPGEPGIMRDPPRRRDEPVLDRRMIRLIVLTGLVTDIAVFLSFVLLLRAGYPLDHLQTVLFAAVGFISVVHAFSLKNMRVPLWRIHPLSNPWLVAGVACGMLLIAITLFVPTVMAAFGHVPLTGADLGLVLSLGAVRVVVIEAVKGRFLSQGARKG